MPSDYNKKPENRKFKLYLYGIEMAVYREPIKIDAFSSNCTFMELKFIIMVQTVRLMFVQIVPLWNWNSICNNLAEQDQRFKLYLYGIEIAAEH